MDTGGGTGADIGIVVIGTEDLDLDLETEGITVVEDGMDTLLIRDGAGNRHLWMSMGTIIKDTGRLAINVAVA